MSLLVVGSVAYDGIETPHGKVDRMLGGAGTYIALAAGHFSPVRLVGIVGSDFAPEDKAVLHDHGVDLEGLEKAAGKTFFWKGVYSNDMNARETIATELNVFADFNPQLRIPTAKRRTSCWATSTRRCSPGAQSGRGPAFRGGDTMNFWIDGTPRELAAAIRGWNFILINDAEARQLSGRYNLRAAARAIQEMGPATVIVKRGEYGAVLFHDGGRFIAPGYLLEEVFDPTGAGDSFAGGFMATSPNKASRPAIRTSKRICAGR